MWVYLTCALLASLLSVLFLCSFKMKRRSLKSVSLTGDFDVVLGAQEEADCLANCTESYPACVFLQDAPVDYNCQLYSKVSGAYENPACPVVWYDPQRLEIAGQL